MSNDLINYGLESYRGSIKQIMKVKHLRAINFRNFVTNYLNSETNLNYLDELNLHSVKYDVMSGYIDLYSNGTNGKCGPKIVDAPIELYKNAYLLLSDILRCEKDIPYKVRRGILVSVYR